jgi:alkanesulfonate monooxygenase SsuD/methylene tetrahydromethanopterin reductase-like flavin-dependent oxidoreductase (luciferase family)
VLSAAAAKTDRIKLGTNVTPLPRRRPWILARQLATLDQISEGRVILGAGLGGDGQGRTAGEEFTRFGEKSHYQVLAEMCDESLDLLRLFWSGNEVNYSGKHYRVEKAEFLPKPIQEPSIPIWIGGNSKAALRRASRHDGWITGGPCPSVGDPGLSPLEVKRKADSIGKKVEIAYAYEYSDDAEERREFLEETRDAGVDWSLDLVSAMRFNGEVALDYIKKGPPI